MFILFKKNILYQYNQIGAFSDYLKKYIFFSPGKIKARREKIKRNKISYQKTNNKKYPFPTGSSFVLQKNTKIIN